MLGLSTAAVASPAPSVRTVAGSRGSGNLSAPSGIALDTAGDLFIADTNRCRVVLVPSRSGTLYGLRVRAGQATSLAGGSCGGTHSLGYPTGVAVDHRGDVFVAEASAQRVQMIRPGGHTPVTVAGTGAAGYSGEGLPGPQSELNQPTGIAVDAAGTLYIADTANCRVRMLPATNGTYFGQTMLAQHLYTVAGTGVCGSARRSGPAAAAQLWNPVAVTTDQLGDLFIADSGDQSILEVPVRSGTDYGTTIGAGGIGTIVGEGGNGPYLQDGLAANGQTAELNDPQGIAVNSKGALFMTDGSQHCIRVVPATTSTVFGRTMQGGDLYTLAGALPVATASGLGNGTRWVLTHMGFPVGLALSASGSVLYSDRSVQKVRAIG
jgi:sugar lactone lactonase YvrE